MKYGSRNKSTKWKGHPMMFGFKESDYFDDFPEGGGYPKRFLKHAFETIGVTDPNKVLHLCSGSMNIGITVDIRPEKNPDYICDCRNTPFDDESFDWIMCDPPYAENYAKNLYGTENNYPKPGQILKECARILKFGGKVGILHFIVPYPLKPLKLRGVWGITTGLGSAIRAWSVFEKVKDGKWRNGI